MEKITVLDHSKVKTTGSLLEEIDLPAEKQVQPGDLQLWQKPLCNYSIVVLHEINQLVHMLGRITVYQIKSVKLFYEYVVSMKFHNLHLPLAPSEVASNRGSVTP